jgi:hypothetical protein
LTIGFSVLPFAACDYLWYLLTIVFSVLPITACDHHFGIFWSLYCLSFSLRLVITTLVSSNFSFSYKVLVYISILQGRIKLTYLVFTYNKRLNLDNRMKNKNTLHHQNSSDIIVKEKTIISMPLMCTFLFIP